MQGCYRTPLSVLWLLLFPMLLGACSQDGMTGTDDGRIETGDVPICFSTPRNEGWNDLKASSRDGSETSFADGDKIGVFAYYGDSAIPDFMNNQEVAYDGASAWSYSPVKYWPQSGVLSFYGYCPYGSEAISISNDASNKCPVLTYSNPNVDIDLMATPVQRESCPSEDKVKLPFKHLLAKVEYAVTVNTENYYSTIHRLVYDVPESGIFRYSWVSNVPEWIIQGDDNITLTKDIKSSEGLVVVHNSPKTVDDFTSYLLPCTVTKYTLTVNNTPLEYNLPEPYLTFQGGKKYKVNFVLENSGEVTHFFIASYSIWEENEKIFEGDLK